MGLWVYVVFIPYVIFSARVGWGVLFFSEFSDPLFGVLQNRLQNLAGLHSDVLESLSPRVRKRVDILREIQVCLLLYVIIQFYAYPVGLYLN